MTSSTRNPNRTLRAWLRWTHIVVGALLATFVYSGTLREMDAFVLLVQVAVVPVAILSGVSMWQQAKLRRMVGGGRPGGRQRGA